MDTSSEPEFEDLAAAAAAVCDTPVALISLVDGDRQWFKAKIGVDLDETPIEMSVCAHGLASHDLLIIPDLSIDTRTATNPLVTDAPHIRFYAGAPLITADGDVIGMLCTIDLTPRSDGLNERQQRGLRALAHQVMRQIVMRRSLQQREQLIVEQHLAGSELTARAEASEAAQEALREMEERSRAAQEAGRVGTFQFDIASDMVQTSPELCGLYGLSIQPSYTASALYDLVVPEDRNKILTAEMIADGRGDFDVEVRIRRADDRQLRWISRRSALVCDDAGRPIRLLGTAHDVTERRLAGERVSALLLLGDRLNDATNPTDVAAIAAEILNSALFAARVGYADIDQASGTFSVTADHVLPGVRSLVGNYGLSAFPATLHRLVAGDAMAIGNVRTDVELQTDVPSYEKMDTQAVINVPLIARGRLTGVLFAHEPVPRAWTREEVEFAQGVGDRAYATLARLRAEGDQAVLNAELSHRLKNTLAMVQAIGFQTLRDVPDREPVEKFERRLHALGTAHDLLLQRSWTSATIEEVARGAIERVADVDRFRLDGPRIDLSAEATLITALVIHELATNAVKYGALSVAEGEVSLHWQVAIDGGEPIFTLEWQERGGPLLTEPKRHGFGTRLINRGLAGTGGAALSYPPEGFVAKFEVPLAIVQRS